MTFPKNVTFNEIKAQPEAWDEAIQIAINHSEDLEIFWSTAFQQYVFIGCGSTYYLSLSAAAFMQAMTKRISRAYPSSELLHSPKNIFPNKKSSSLLIALSRSGTTTETHLATRNFKEDQQCNVITVTNYPNSKLNTFGDVKIAIPSGQEKSVAQTKSFTSMYVACTTIALLAGHFEDLISSMNNLPSIGENLLNEYDYLAQELGQDQNLNQFFFLGSSNLYGLACEASLKLKEMSLTVSEPFHFLEFRHGPISMVNSNTMVIGLLSEERRKYEEPVLEQVRSLGGRTLSLGELNTDVSFQSSLPEPVRGVLYLPILQLMAYYRAINQGLNPDKPRNLNAVVELKIP